MRCEYDQVYKAAGTPFLAPMRRGEDTLRRMLNTHSLLALAIQRHPAAGLQRGGSGGAGACGCRDDAEGRKAGACSRAKKQERSCEGARAGPRRPALRGPARGARAGPPIRRNPCPDPLVRERERERAAILSSSSEAGF